MQNLVLKASIVGMEGVKLDPQRLSERAEWQLAALMRQSDLRGDAQTLAETTKALAST